jgi:UDP-N-acetyl-D-glucosamine/UDP-N-acetyl-D-galactosamine dehydrogenase
VDAARVLVLGFTFKENVPDTRNTKIADLVAELSTYVAEVQIYDPMADAAEAKHEYGLTIANTLPEGQFDAVVLAVKHDAITELVRKGLDRLVRPGGVVYDIKGLVPPGMSHARL